MSKEDDPALKRLGVMPHVEQPPVPVRTEQGDQPAAGVGRAAPEVKKIKEKKVKPPKKERSRRVPLRGKGLAILGALLLAGGAAGYLDYKKNTEALDNADAMELDLTNKQQLQGAECLTANIVLKPGVTIRNNPTVVSKGRLPLTKDNVAMTVPAGSEIVVHRPSTYADADTKNTWLGFIPEDNMESQALIADKDATIQQVIDSRVWVNYTSLQAQKGPGDKPYFEVSAINGLDAKTPAEACKIGQNGVAAIGDVATSTSITFPTGGFQKATQWQNAAPK